MDLLRALLKEEVLSFLKHHYPDAYKGLQLYALTLQFNSTQSLEEEVGLSNRPSDQSTVQTPALTYLTEYIEPAGFELFVTEAADVLSKTPKTTSAPVTRDEGNSIFISPTDAILPTPTVPSTMYSTNYNEYPIAPRRKYVKPSKRMKRLSRRSYVPSNAWFEPTLTASSPSVPIDFDELTRYRATT